MLSPAGLAAGSSLTVTRFLREHGSDELLDASAPLEFTSSADASAGLQLVPADSESQEASWPPEARRACIRLRNEVAQLKSKLEVAEACAKKFQLQLQTAKAELDNSETAKMQSLQLRSQIDMAKCEAINEQTRREAADAEAKSLKVCVSSLELENAKVLKAMAESEQHLIDSEARNNALHTQLQQQSDVAGAAIEDANARAAALQAQMVDKTKKMRAVISKTKVESQQRLYASEAKHRDILGQLAEERTTLVSELDQAKARCTELEACLEHQQRSITDMLDRASVRNDENLQACDAKARELQSQMVQQKECATAELDKASERIAELEMKLAHQQRMVQGEIARLQEENQRNKQMHDERSNKLEAQLGSQRLALTSELDAAGSQKQELRAQLSRQREDAQNAVARERAESEQQMQAKDAKHRELQTQLAEKSALGQRNLMRVSELEMQLAEQRQMFEDRISRSNSELEQHAWEAKLRTGELQSQLTQQRETTASCQEQAMLRASELEVETASHRRLRQTDELREQQARADKTENSELRAELEKQRRANAASRESEAMQAYELRENLAGEARAMQDALARERAAGSDRLQACEALMEDAMARERAAGSDRLRACEDAVAREKAAGSDRMQACEDAVARERAAGRNRLQACEDFASKLKSEHAQQLVDATRAKESTAAQGRDRLQACEDVVSQLRSEHAQQLADATRAKEGTAAQAAELKRLESLAASQQKKIREGQHELDAHESTSALMREQTEQECQALSTLRHRENAAETRNSELESELTHQCNAMKAAVSWAKANTKQRVKSLTFQRDKHREAESQLAQQENELRELLELVKLQSEQDLQACEARNIDLQAELSAQREHLREFEARGEELAGLLQQQREATAVEHGAMESINELANDLAKQRDEANEQCEARVKKLKARIQDLEMMLDISKECLKVEPHRAVDTDAEASIISIRHSPTKTAGPGTSQDWSLSRPIGTSQDWSLSTNLALKSGMQASKSASSLHSAHSGSGSSVSRRTNAFVVKNVGFSWRGRHLGPDQEGPISVKYDDSLVDGRVR